MLGDFKPTMKVANFGLSSTVENADFFAKTDRIFRQKASLIAKYDQIHEKTWIFQGKTHLIWLLFSVLNFEQNSRSVLFVKNFPA